MKKKFQITIPSPCPRSWDGMPAAEKGRYCGHCNTEVVDFSGWTDAEIASYVLNSETKICGMLHTRPVITRFAPAAASRFRLLAVLSMTSVLGLAYAKKPGDDLQIFPQILYPTETSLHGISPGPLADSLIIKGRVQSAEKGIDYLPGVHLKAMGSTKTPLAIAITNDQGVFELKVPRTAKRLELRLAYIGFKRDTIRIRVPDRDILDLGTIQLARDNMVMGEVIIVRPEKN